MAINKEEIQKQAKEILEKFAKALEKVDSKDLETGVDRDEFEREEGYNINRDSNEFKKAILKNAPESDQDFIITEKGDWK